jgi:hypothetical protein
MYEQWSFCFIMCAVYQGIAQLHLLTKHMLLTLLCKNTCTIFYSQWEEMGKCIPFIWFLSKTIRILSSYTDITLMIVNVFHVWLHVSSVSIENGREYHGESHYITRMSNPYSSYSLSRFWEDWLSQSTLKFLENSYLPVFQHEHANLL